mgnify:FL=1
MGFDLQFRYASDKILRMSNTSSGETGFSLSSSQKMLLMALGALYTILMLLWWMNNRNKPLLGVGSVEGFNRMPPPVAAEAPMTWRFAPSIAQMAVPHVISPAAVATEIKRLEKIGEGANGAVVYRASYLSDSITVYGVLGVPAKTPAPAVVVCHPSDSPYQTGMHTLDTVKWLAELGILAFAPDYRGWGPSGGTRGTEVRDVYNALATLRADDANVRDDRIGLIGYSMGGGIAATAAAADTNLALLVLYYPQMRGSVEELQSAVRYGQFEKGSGGIRQLIQEARAAGADASEMEYTLRMISPIYHLREFAGRVALFHSEDDQVVSIRQSEGLVNEYGRLGKPVKIFKYKDLGHAFANSIENKSKADLEAVLKESLLAG